MEKHFVHFFSPGTFCAEETVREIPSWDIELAKDMAKTVTERYNATPFGFQFVTRCRGPRDFDSKETKRSCMFYLGGKIETYAEVVARNDPSEQILRDNMRINKIDRILINTNSWKYTAQLKSTDVVLEWP